MVDFVTGAFDSKISVGMIVAYPGRQGSSLWLTKAKVLEIGSDKDWRGKDYSWIKVERLAHNTYQYDDSWNKIHRAVVTLTNVHNVIPFGVK